MTLISKHGLALAAVIGVAGVSASAEIVVSEAYARAMPGSQMGAVFMQIENTGPDADRLIAASTEAANRVELHTHTEDENGVFRMREVEAGFEIAPGEVRLLARGGDHVMLMGLTEALADGDEVSVTLTFETQGALEITATVDNERGPAMMSQGHNHGHAHNDDAMGGTADTGE